MVFDNPLVLQYHEKCNTVGGLRWFMGNNAKTEAPSSLPLKLHMVEGETDYLELPFDLVTSPTNALWQTECTHT